MFFGEKLQGIRELNGLSRKELADSLSLSEQAIWQYENHYTTPKFEVVNDIKKIFNVKAQYFYTEPFVKNVSNIENIAYRATDREVRKKAKMETTFIDFISHFIDTFESKLNLPQDTITLLRNESIHLYNTSYPLEMIAKNAREKLDVHSNKDLLYKLESSGIYVLEKNMGAEIDAYSTWTKDEKPFIILGNIKKSAVRRNFDLAHELGHLLLHYKVDMDNLTKDERRKIEKEADNFAAFFLLPTKDFIKDFSLISKKSNPDSYIELKMKYMVSIAALEYRAYKLGLLSFEENRYFYAVLNKKEYRISEPLDEDIAIIKPGKIRALLDLIFSHKLLNANDILSVYHIDSLFLENLLGFDNNFLEQYTETSNQNYFNDSNVIPLFAKNK